MKSVVLSAIILSMGVIALLGVGARSMQGSSCTPNGTYVTFLVAGGHTTAGKYNWTALPGQAVGGTGYAIKEIVDQYQGPVGQLYITYSSRTPARGVGIPISIGGGFVSATDLKAPSFAYSGGSGDGALVTLEQCQT